MAWTAEQREAAQKALAEGRCPDCGLIGQKAYAIVGPFRWAVLNCTNCNGCYDMTGPIATWFWDAIFGRFWTGKVLIPCEAHK